MSRPSNSGTSGQRSGCCQRGACGQGSSQGPAPRAPLATGFQQGGCGPPNQQSGCPLDADDECESTPNCQEKSCSPVICPEVQKWFNAVDRNHSGKISARELQSALCNGQGRNFSVQACNLMIGMFDCDNNGTIDITEFQQLYNYINEWIATFRSYDRDHSGHMEERELCQAFQQMGFRFSPEFIRFLICKSDLQSHSRIAVDQFIVLCVQIQRFTVSGYDPHDHTNQSFFDKRIRKRKYKKLRNDEKEEEEDEREETDDLMSVAEYKTSFVESRESEMEIVRLRAELNQLITENVQLIQENRNLHEENYTLKQKTARLEKENSILQQEHQTALELTSWLNSAKEIVENLKERSESVLPPCAQSALKSHVSAPRRTQRVDDVEAQSIKQELLDEIQAQGEDESPYHTPLLNFDQVDLIPNLLGDRTKPDNDAEGREQLLHPEPVEGVCELCPGSRIFVTTAAFDVIQNKRSHSSVARGCLEAIFKMSYLLTCSVQGNIAKGPYGKPEFQRPSLYKPAVESILKYARYHAERHGWKIEENTTIKKQMNTRLSELRNIAKLKNNNILPTQSENT